MISVIVPIYNTERYLRPCVASILGQTHKDFELLLIDDGSTDSCGDICDELCQADKRIRTFHVQNSGVTKAREYGVNKAFGDFVTFVDSDDTIDRHYLEHMYNHMNDNVDIVALGGDKNSAITVNEYLSKLFAFRFWSSCSKLYRKTLLTQYVFSTNPEIKVAEDFLMQLKICTNLTKSVVIITEKLYNYNLDNPASAMHSYVRSREYEETILSEVASVMMAMPEYVEYNRDYFNYRCHMLGGMIGFGYRLSNEDDWIKVLKKDSHNLKLSLRQHIILSAPNNAICRALLVSEKKIRNIISRLIKQCTRIIKL